MAWLELSDRELVEMCLRDGQPEAWTEFLRRFQRLIANVVTKTIRTRIPPTRNLVDDLVQETLLKICNNNCRAMRTFQWMHENSFRGFLKVTSSNVVRDYFRKHPPTRIEEDLDETGPDVPRTEDSTRSVEKETLVRELVACMQKWTQSEEDCNRNLSMFLLFYWHGCTAKEISGIYPVTLKAVENTLLRLGRIARKHCMRLTGRAVPGKMS